MTTQELFDYEQEALASFEAALKPSSASSDVSREIARLEGRLEQLHSIAVVAARQTDDIEQVSNIWRAMVKICDDAAKRVHDLAFNNGKGDVSYDKILDLLSDCRERHAFHA